MGLVYFFLLPASYAFRNTTVEYAAVPTTDEAESDEVDDIEPTVTTPEALSIAKPSLSTAQKLELARPLFWKFMIPLFVVYFAEVGLRLQTCPKVQCIIDSQDWLYSTPSILESRQHFSTRSQIARSTRY